MKEKAIVLLSGGIDSAVAAYWAAIEKGWEVHALSLNYGHKAQVELDCAREIADRICETHVVLDLSVLKEVIKSPLINMDILQEENDREGDSYYVVPLRNSIFLTIASAYAESIGAKHVVLGNQQEDGKGFPDTTKEAMDTMQIAIIAASEKDKAPTLWSPWQETTKDAVIQKGLDLGVPFEHTYSCYEDGTACGICEACEYRWNAFRRLGVKDPIAYKVTPREY